MPPVKEHIVDEIEVVGHRDARIAPGVAGKKIVMEASVAPAPVAAESVIVGVERLAGNYPLNRDVDGRQLERRATIGWLIHVAICVNVLILSPACGDVIQNDVTNGIAEMHSVPVEDVQIATAKTQVC